MASSNSGGGTLNWSVSDNNTWWLDENPVSGDNNNQTVTVSVNTTDLLPGTYTSTITVSSANAQNGPQTIPVTYTVSPPSPSLLVNIASLSFGAVQTGSLPMPQSFVITNTGTGTLNWSISDDNTLWMDQNPVSGDNNSQTVTVSVNTTNLLPGTYTSTITVSSANAENSPRTISVTYTVSLPPPRLQVNLASLSFNAVQNGSLPPSKTFLISNTGGGTLNWSVSDNNTLWVDQSPVSGDNNSQTVTVSVNSTNLLPGTYTATITVGSSNADNSPKTIPVTYTISSPSPHLQVDLASLSFNAVQNGSLPPNKTFLITNTGGGTLNWSVSDNNTLWVDQSPLSGASNSQTVTVSVNTTNLTPATYTATITVSSSNADNSSQIIAVTYTVAPPSPHLQVNLASMSFNAIQNGTLPVGKTFLITNTGGGTLNWSVSDNNALWLDQNPVSGNNNSQTVTVSVNTTNLAPGTYTATITVSSSNADNSPQTIAVDYVVSPAPPKCTVQPSDLAFGDVKVGLTKDLTFTITNDGGSVLSGTVSESCNDYSIISGGGPYNLDPGTAQTVTVRFLPTAKGTRNCDIQTGDAICDVVKCTGKAFVPITVSAKPVADAVVTKQSSSSNFGSTKTMSVVVSTSLESRSFIRFDLSDLPQGAPIESATLNLRSIDPRDNPGDITMCRVSETWDEDEVTWKEQPNTRTPCETVPVPESSDGWWSARIDSIVTYWVDGGSNRGLRLAITSGRATFVTREGDQSYIPQLIIVYKSY